MCTNLTCTQSVFCVDNCNWNRTMVCKFCKATAQYPMSNQFLKKCKVTEVPSTWVKLFGYDPGVLVKQSMEEE